MGREFVFVNLDKKEFVNPNGFGESAKSSSYLEGITANAIALLVCKPTDVTHQYGELAGSWFGDRIIAAGDDDCAPNQDGITTATADEPDRNLHQMARVEFGDVTYVAMLMMSRGNSWAAEQFARYAKKYDTRLFISLATDAIEQNIEELQWALESVNGANWKTKYKKACEKYEVAPAI